MIYLDYAATTPIQEAIIEALPGWAHDFFGNPSSLHQKGLDVEREIAAARAQIAHLFSADPRELYFTSGGTEANNIAILGLVSHRMKGRVLTTAIEHASVLEPMRYLKQQGFDVVEMPVDEDGQLTLETLEGYLTPDTRLVSVMHVNNELGTIQPIEAIREYIDAYNRAHRTQILLHVDAIQSFGKLPMPRGVDAMSVSAHKIGGLKGTGALYIKKGRTVAPRVFGGGQERGLRSGTENTLGILAMGVAAAHMQSTRDARSVKVTALKRHAIERLNAFNGCILNCPGGSPYILNASFPGARGEVLLHMLEAEGIYVSTGSACGANKKGRSHVLEAMGYPAPRIDGAIRLSFDAALAISDLEGALDALTGHAGALADMIGN